MPVFITIGYNTEGVNFLSMIFAPDYDNEDPKEEVRFEVGYSENDMNFVNLAFSQQNSFIGFMGVTSSLGLSINELGVVFFTCAKAQITSNNSSIKQDGLTVDGSGNLLTNSDELEKQEAAENAKASVVTKEIQIEGDEAPSIDSSNDGGSGALVAVILITLGIIVVAAAVAALLVYYFRSA